MVKRQRFTAVFKREAVRLLDAGQRHLLTYAAGFGLVVAARWVGNDAVWTMMRGRHAV